MIGLLSPRHVRCVGPKLKHYDKQSSEFPPRSTAMSDEDRSMIVPGLIGSPIKPGFPTLPHGATSGLQGFGTVESPSLDR